MNIKKNERVKEAFLEQLRKTPILQIACEKMGLHRMSVYRWRKEDKAFDEAVEGAILDGRLLVNDLAESQLIGAIKDRNMHAIITWLKHHHPSYAAKVKIEGELNVIEELTPEQKELVAKALQLAQVTLGKYADQ